MLLFSSLFIENGKMKIMQKPLSVCWFLNSLGSWAWNRYVTRAGRGSRYHIGKIGFRPKHGEIMSGTTRPVRGEANGSMNIILLALYN